MITEVGNIPTKLDSGTVITAANWNTLPEDGTDFDGVNHGNAVQPGNSSITGGVYSGSKYIMDYGKGGRSMQTVSIEAGLEADTEYVAYFVLKGESSTSISDVYAFRFKTEKVVRPIIQSSLSTTTAVTVKADREADINYIVMVASNTSAVFKNKMSAYAEDDDAWEAYAEAQGYSVDMTILEAMRLNVSDGVNVQGSVFDHYADQVIKDMVTAQVANVYTDGSSIIDAGSLALTSRKLSDTLSFEKVLAGKGECWFVAVGKSPLGSGYAFTAASYLYEVDNQHPMVISLETASNSVYTTMAEAYKGTYTGTVQVTFDEALFYRESADKILQVVDKFPVGAGNYISSVGLLTTTGISVEHQDKGTSASGYSPCYSLILKFNGITQGSTISLTNLISDAGGNYGGSDGALTLTLTIDEVSKGVYVPKFILKNSNWNAMED